MIISMRNVTNRKKPVQSDWHSAYIIYRLRLRGLSFRKLARLNGYAAGSTSYAAHVPWPKMERLIASAIGVPPQEIWPSRYHDDGSPKSGRNARGIGRSGTTKYKDNTARARRNVQVKAVA